MRFGRTAKSMLALAMVAGTAIAVSPSASSTPVSALAPTCTALCGGGEYHPIAAPIRIFDTRQAVDNLVGPINDVPPAGRKPMSQAGNGFDVDLLGLDGTPLSTPWLPAEVTSPSDVLAVVASVIVVTPSQKGYLKTYATGEAVPNASLVNFIANRNVSNLAVLRPNAQGLLTLSLTGVPGNADVVIDVFGWFSTTSYNPSLVTPSASPRGARMIPIDPVRLADTRLAGGALGTNSALQVPIRGAVQMGTSTPAVVPDDPNVVGVVLNVTGVLPNRNTYLSVVPADPAGVAPTTSNVNLLAGTIKANLVIAPVNAGSVWIYNYVGNTHVVVDVVGYLMNNVDETTRAGRVVPLTTPFRAFDTRSPQFGSVPLGPRQSEDWSFAAFSGSVNIGGVSVGNQSAMLGNLTNAALARQNPFVTVGSFLTVYPSPGSPGNPPTISNLNTVDPTIAGGVPVPNMALVRYNPANQTVRVYNNAGYADYLLDVSAVILAD